MTRFLLSLGRDAPKGAQGISPAGPRKTWVCLCCMTEQTSSLVATRADHPPQLGNMFLCSIDTSDQAVALDEFHCTDVILSGRSILWELGPVTPLSLRWGDVELEFLMWIAVLACEHPPCRWCPQCDLLNLCELFQVTGQFCHFCCVWVPQLDKISASQGHLSIFFPFLP